MGKVSMTDLKQYLGLEAANQNYSQRCKAARVSVKLQDYISSVMNPEDILCEQERLEEVQEVIQRIIDTLPEKQSKAFQLIIILGKKQEDAAKILKCTHQNVSYHIKKALEFIKKKFDLSSLHPNIISARALKKSGGAKVKIRYPSEFLSKLETGGRNGKSIKVAHTKCVMDLYLDEAFRDTKTTCKYCDKCVNKLMKSRVEAVNLRYQQTA